MSSFFALIPDAKNWLSESDNPDIDFEKITPGSHKSLLWICPSCGKKYYQSPKDRIIKKDGCYSIRKCSCEVKLDSSVAKHPEILKFWNYKKNPKPESVLAKSTTNVNFICPICKYEWVAQVRSRYLKESPCPHCRDGNNAFMLVENIQSWIDKSNQTDLMSVSPRSEANVVWRCPDCNEVFSQRICSRVTLSNGKFIIKPCIKCNKKHTDYSKIDIALEHPELLDLWLEEINGPISNIKKASQIYKWKCPTCERTFDSTLKQMIKSKYTPHRGCKYCSKYSANIKDSFGSLHPELLDEYSSENKVDPFNVSENSRINVKWNCEKGHEYYQTFKKRVAGYGCPVCGEIPNSRMLLKDEMPGLKQYFDEKKSGIPFSKARLYPKEQYSWKCNNGHCFNWWPIRFKYNQDFYCPICEPKVFVPGLESVEERHPELMKEWDYVNNYLLANPKEISDTSTIVVWWNCPNNKKHHYPLRVDRRIYYDLRKHEACPFCRGFRIKKHHFI